MCLVLVWTISHAAPEKLVGAPGVTAVTQLHEFSIFFSHFFFVIALACPLPFTACPRHTIWVWPGGLLCLAFTTMALQWLLRIAWAQALRVLTKALCFPFLFPYNIPPLLGAKWYSRNWVTWAKSSEVNLGRSKPWSLLPGHWVL